MLTCFRPPSDSTFLSVQLLLHVLTDLFETLQEFATWSEDVHVV